MLLHTQVKMNKWIKIGRFEVGVSTPWHVGVLTCCVGCTIYCAGWLFVTVNDKECTEKDSVED